MKVLIIGGTRFVGRALVEAVLAKDFELTLFNRQKSNKFLFSEVEQIKGDRDKGFAALDGRDWDVVIDTCCYYPKQAKEAADFFRSRTKRYFNISTISVYKTPPPMDAEEAATKCEPADDFNPKDKTPATYGTRKYVCERVLDDNMPDQVLNIRPAVIVGPFDETWRFNYWLDRVSKGGEILVPPLESPLSFIDVRDLADWTVKMIEAPTIGAFTIIGPEENLTFGEFLKACKEVTESDAEFVEVSEEFLMENGIQGWDKFPLWLPKDYWSMHRFCDRKAKAHGLVTRKVKNTVIETMRWLSATNEDELPSHTTLKAKEEKNLISKWRKSLES